MSATTLANKRLLRTRTGKKEKKDKGKKDKGKKDKVKSSQIKQPDSQASASGPAYADGAPLDRITYCEAKLILKADRFTSVQAFRDFGKIVKSTAKKVIKPIINRYT